MNRTIHHNAPIIRWSKTLIIVLNVLACGHVCAQTTYVTIDRFVPHESTVHANQGQRIGIFVHEKLTKATADAIKAGRSSAGVVLFVHGASVPSVPAYDLPFRDYSWMAFLADAGFDTFTLDHTGYGFSPRPTMDDPCNMSEENQAIAAPNSLSVPCEPSYAHRLTSLASDWDEIDSVVDYLLELRGVERVHLIGWSLGGPRAGGYASRYPEKVDKLVLFAPVYRASSPAESSDPLPADVPMRLQTREALMQTRWESAVTCDDQVEDGIRDVIWQTIMGFEPVGAVWGPRGGVMRVRTSRSYGWNRDYAAKITAPTLIMVGDQDGLLPHSEALYPDLTGASNKVLAKMACSTHFALWEATQYKFMHEASKEWLISGTMQGRREGSVAVGIYRGDR